MPGAFRINGRNGGWRIPRIAYYDFKTLSETL
jgi:hypothetical protein